MLSGCTTLHVHYSMFDLARELPAGQGSLVWSLLLAGAFTITAAGGACLTWALLRWGQQYGLDKLAAQNTGGLPDHSNLIPQTGGPSPQV
jgi:hypothetical protein